MNTLFDNILSKHYNEFEYFLNNLINNIDNNIDNNIHFTQEFNTLVKQSYKLPNGEFKSWLYVCASQGF